METNRGILALRSWSLRWILVISFLTGLIFAIITGLGNSGPNYKIVGIAQSIPSILLYIVFAVRAVENDDKATKVAYVFAAASFISAIVNCDSTKYWFAFEGISYDEMSYWAPLIMSDYIPLALLANIFMVGGALYALSCVRKKLMIAWYIHLLGNIILGFGALIALVTNKYQPYWIFSMIGGVIALVFMIVILFTGGRERVAKQTAIVQTASIVEQSKDSDFATKTEELLKLKELLDANILTQEEFDREKREY